MANVLDKYQYLDKKERAFLTRLTEGTLEQLIQIEPAARSIPIFRSANMSLGNNELMDLVRLPAAKLGHDIDV